ARALRQPVRDAVPLLDGLSPAADSSGRRLAPPRACLSAADAVGDDPQMDRRLRAARIAAARPDTRAGRIAPAERRRSPLRGPREGRGHAMISRREFFGIAAAAYGAQR